MADYEFALYGVFRRLAQSDHLTLCIPEQSDLTIDEVLNALSSAHPEMSEILKVTACAVSDELLPRESPVSPGVTIALIPPVSGGQ